MRGSGFLGNYRAAIGLRAGLCCGMVVGAVGILPGTMLVAQATARVIQGKVMDKGDTALKGAVVYLKDGHTLQVKSYISTEDGGYRFGQLAQSTDYTVWAESAGKKSPVKSISSFDSKNEFNINLKIDTAK